MKKAGAKPKPYRTKPMFKRIPEAIYDKCLSLLDAEVLKYNLKIKKK